MKPAKRLVRAKRFNPQQRRARGFLANAIVALICLPACACVASNTLGVAPVSTTGRVPVSSNLQSRVGGSEFIGSTVQGMNRVCSYRGGPVGAAVRTYRIGYSDRCPPHYPSSDPNFPMQPTARLQASSTEQGRRNCSYAEGSARWTVTLPLTQTCPLNAGLAAQLQAGSGEEERRLRPPSTSVAATTNPSASASSQEQ